MIYGTQILKEIERKRMKEETKLMAFTLVLLLTILALVHLLFKLDDKLADARKFCIQTKMRHDFCLNYFK